MGLGGWVGVCFVGGRGCSWGVRLDGCGRVPVIGGVSQMLTGAVWEGY